MSQVHSKIINFLQFFNMDITDERIQAFLNQFEFDQSFSNYENLEGQIGALKKHFNYVQAKDIWIGDQLVTTYNSKKDAHEVVKKSLTMRYVSLLDTLKLVLSNSEVYEYIKRGLRKLDDNILRGFEDGENIKKIFYFQSFQTL